MKITRKEILKPFNLSQLSLEKGTGYWYFVYDDEALDIFETHSVYCMYLNDMDIEQWQDAAIGFLKDVEQVIEDKPYMDRMAHGEARINALEER